MNMPVLDGWGSRRSSVRRSRASASARTVAAAVGASTLLFLAACGTTGTEAPRSTDTAAAVTTGSNPGEVSDPSAAGGQADQPVAATQGSPDQPAATAATTDVPAPRGPGNIEQTVPTTPATSNPPVALDASGDLGNGVTVALTTIESVTTQAELPGEVAGPGVRLEVTITNGSAGPINVGNVIVDLTDAAGTPAISMTSGATPFTGSVDSGATASAVYVFTVPATYTNPATVSVGYSADAPVAVFTGDAR